MSEKELSEKELNYLADKVLSFIASKQSKAKAGDSKAFDLKKPADLSPWGNTEGQAILHAQGSTGSKSYNMKNIIMQDESYSIGDVFFSIKQKHTENARFIWLDNPGGNILSQGAYPKLYQALQGTPFLDLTHAVEGEFKIIDFTSRPYLKGTPVLGLVDESLPALGLSSTIQSTATDHNHPLSGAGHSVDTGKIGEFWTRDNNNEAFHCTDANGDFYTHGGGSVNVWEGDDGDIISTTQYTKTGLNDRQRPLGGTTDTKTQSHAHGITNSYGALYSGGTQVNTMSIGLFRYMVGDRQV